MQAILYLALPKTIQRYLFSMHETENSSNETAPALNPPAIPVLMDSGIKNYWANPAAIDLRLAWSFFLRARELRIAC